MENSISLFWFRRDLRLEDNKGLSEALKSGNKILPVFIFDEEILDRLPKNDARVSFIYETLYAIDKELIKYNSSLLIKVGNPIAVWKKLSEDYNIQAVYTNKDYEPYAIKRDAKVDEVLASKNIQFKTFKDQVIFEKNEVVKDNGDPYIVYTP